MQVKDTTKSTFFQLFSPLLTFFKHRQSKDVISDRYIKKMTTLQLIELLACSQLEQHPGLRDISAMLSNQEFSRVLSLDSISHSQISRRLRDLSIGDTELIFHGMVMQIIKEIGSVNTSKLLGQLYLIDASTITLCLSRYPWAVFRKSKGGVKLHLRLRFCDEVSIPERAIITPAKPADKTQMDNLVVEDQEAINVFDRGYVDYDKFDEFCLKGIRFVTRLKGNAIIEVLDEFLTTDASIRKDQLVVLGKGFKRMKRPLRLVETEDSEGNPVVIVTNDLNLTASEISSIFRHRWQIELFFKWIKQHLKIKHFYGLSPAAVENQIFIALITYCLGLLLKLKTGAQGSLLIITRLLKNCICMPFAAFIKLLKREASRISNGRRKLRDKLIYQFTVEQVMSGDLDYLYDLVYDPLML
jgi:IS5 family transposase